MPSINKNKLPTFASTFFRHGLIIYFFNYLGAILNYLFQYISGDRLSLTILGEFESLFSLFSLITIIIGSLNFSLLEYFSRDNKVLVNHQLKKVFYRLSFYLLIFLCLLYPIISNFLKIYQPINYLILIISLVLSLNTIVYVSFLQSKYKFLLYSLIGLGGSIIRTAILYFTLSPYLSLFLSTLFGLLVAMYIVNQLNHSPATSTPPPFVFIKTSLIATTSILFLNYITTQDLLLIRHFFSASLSGVYASANIIGKVLFFATTPILTIAIPVFIQHRQHSRKLLYSIIISLLSTAIIGSLLLFIFATHTTAVVKLLFHSTNFYKSISIIPLYSLEIFTFSLLNILVQILICLQKKSAAIIPIIVAALQLTLIFLFHSQTTQVINATIISIFVGILLSLASIYRYLAKLPPVN